MQHQTVLLVAAVFLAVSAEISFAQCAAGPIGGNLIGHRTRIHDFANLCGCAAYTGGFTLHLLDSDQPGLRLSNNTTGQTCSGDVHGDVAVATVNGMIGNPPVPNLPNYRTHSLLQEEDDFLVVADETANNLIISNSNAGGSIRFGTAPPTALGGVDGHDAEHMILTDIGHLGIATSDPKELLQIWKKSVWHAGTDDDYIGYNVYTTYPSGSLVRIEHGYTARLEFEKDGNVYLGMAGTGNAGTSADFEEAAGRYRGLSMKHNTSGDGVFAFGVTSPDNNTRLTIRSHGEDGNTNALLIESAAATQLVRTYSDGKVLIGTGSAHVKLDGPGLQVKGDVFIGDEIDPENYNSNGFSNALMVDGIIYAHEVAVQDANWSDYVFDDDYKLMPLEELQAYIDENRHLPNIPTQKEVSERGVRVSEFQASILAKVEELTLYVLHLSQQNKELRHRLELITKTNE